jgi:hypothetical protein
MGDCSCHCGGNDDEDDEKDGSGGRVATDPNGNGGLRDGAAKGLAPAVCRACLCGGVGGRCWRPAMDDRGDQQERGE